MISDQIRSLLVQPPGAFPLYAVSFKISVKVTPAGRDLYPTQADVDFLKDNVGSSLGAAFRQGFFAGHSIGNPVRFEFSRSANGDLNFVCSSPQGVHRNAVTAILRWAIDANHTPLDSYEDSKRVLAEEGVTLPERKVIGNLVAGIEIAAEATDNRSSEKDLFEFLLDKEMASVPMKGLGRDLSAYCESDRVAAVRSNGDQNLGVREFPDVEDAFLRLCDCSVFKKIEDFDSGGREGDFDVWIRDGQLLFDDYDCELYGLAEFVNAVTGGQAASFELRDGE